MGLEDFGGVVEAVALFVGGLRSELAALSGVGAFVAVLWFRRRWRDVDVHVDVIVRGARNSRTCVWLRANVLGERSRADMVCCCGGGTTIAR